MQIKKENHKKARSSSHTIIHALESFNKKVHHDLANLRDVELLVSTIIAYLKHADESIIKKRTHFVAKQAKEYRQLCSFLIRTHQQTQPNQLVKLDYGQFDKYLRANLIQPMILKLAETSTTQFFSEYLGTVPILDLYSQSNHSYQTLREIDLHLSKNSQTIMQNASPLLPFMHTFRLLNKNSSSMRTPKTHKLLANYLLDISQQQAPRLVFGASQLVQMFQESDVQERLNGITLTHEKIILIAIDNHLSINTLLLNIFYEFQRLFNSYFMAQTKAHLAHFRAENMASFIKFMSSMRYSSQLFADLAFDIRSILAYIHDGKPEKLNLDTLSSLFTPLLFHYSDKEVRELIKEIFFKLEIENGQGNEACLNICNTLSNAFFCIEYTLNRLTSALLQFNIDFMHEFITLNFEDCNAINEIKAVLFLKNKEQKEHWQEFLLASGHILGGGEILLNLLTAPTNCLLTQVKEGNYRQLKILLHLKRKQINMTDKKGFSLLAYAVMYNHSAIYKLLLQCGADSNWLTRETNANLLHLAASYGSFDLIPLLLNHGFSVFTTDKDKHTPLYLLAKYMTWEEASSIKPLYPSSIHAFATLLSYSRAEPSESNFYTALIQFRKNIALLYLLHAVKALPGLSLDIIQCIAHAFDGPIPCIAFVNCYKDISQHLHKNKTDFQSFLTMGRRSIYTDLPKETKPSPGFMQRLFSVKQDASQVQKNAAIQQYYSPRSLHAGINSLAAVVLAQKDLRKSKDHLTRKQAIERWKHKVANHDDKGLKACLLLACTALHIEEMDNKTYHRISTILYDMVVKLNRTPADYTCELFKANFVEQYLEVQAKEKIHAMLQAS